ncbi:MAG: VTT domain-containing protein [Actinobacteria bacterium]|nr:VTT domain-containing protein [Actinomycetota bacterium]
MDNLSIVHFILKYGYPIIFLLVVYEGPLITIISSFLAASGLFNVFIIYPLVVIADLTGDIIWYYVGYFGREKIITRWGRFLGLPYSRMDKFEKINERFKNHQGKILFSAKVTHVIGFPFLIVAGIFKWDIKKFMWFNFLATLPKSLLWVIIGYFFGQASVTISKYLKYSTFISIGILILSILIYFIIIKIAKRFFKNYEV